MYMDKYTLMKLDLMNNIIIEYKRGLITYEEFVYNIALIVNACNPKTY